MVPSWVELWHPFEQVETCLKEWAVTRLADEWVELVAAGRWAG